jgi:4-amino-4-deoxy-L-arabinose transferase-like glycosyltransferase
MALLFLGVCLPWYGAAARVNGMAFLGGFLGFSNLQRFTSVLYDHPGPPWFYLPWVMVLLLPWSLFLPAAIGATGFWRWDRWRPAGGGDEGARAGGGGEEGRAIAQLPLLLLLWLGLMVAFFSAAATKLPGYILPALPAGALLVALWWQPLAAPAGGGAPAPPHRWPLLASGWANAALLGLLAAAAALAPRWAASDPAHPALALALERSGLPLRLALLLALASLALVLLLRRPRGQRWLWVPDLAAFLAVLALVVAPLAPLLDRERQLPLRQLAVLARRQARADEPLWVVGTKRYSILFYGGETAAFVAGRQGIEDRWREDPTALGLTPRTRSLRLLGDRRDLDDLQIPPAQMERLGQRGEQELWRVSLEALRP